MHGVRSDGGKRQSCLVTVCSCNIHAITNLKMNPPTIGKVVGKQVKQFIICISRSVKRIVAEGNLMAIM